MDRAHLSPVTAPMAKRSTGGKQIPVPQDIEEGVTVTVSRASIEFGQYHLFLQQAADPVGVDHGSSSNRICSAPFRTQRDT